MPCKELGRYSAYFFAHLVLPSRDPQEIHTGNRYFQNPCRPRAVTPYEQQASNRRGNNADRTEECSLLAFHRTPPTNNFGRIECGWTVRASKEGLRTCGDADAVIDVFVGSISGHSDLGFRDVRLLKQPGVSLTF